MNLLDYEQDHLSRVRAGLSECMVLLKKNGAFPLENPCRLAAYGSGVRHTVKGGTGSGEVNSHFTVNIEQGLTEAGFDLTSKDWLDAYDAVLAKAKKTFRRQVRREARTAHENIITFAMGSTMCEPEYDLPLNAGADAAVYVVSRISGEGADRKPVSGDVLLTESEIRDILELDALYERFMLVLNTGGPVDLSPVKDISNILVLSQLGAETGRALADVLLGKAVPSGKLTTTWAAWDQYCKRIHFGYNDETEYREGIYVGYRYFDTVGEKALFPFGYGLSYTDFAVDHVHAFPDGSTVTVTARIENTGSFAGKEVLQIYVTAPEVRLKKPWQELAGFAKTTLLQPGEAQTVQVAFDMADIASFDDERLCYCLEPGKYILRAGTSSTDTVPFAVIVLTKEVVSAQVKPVAPDPNATLAKFVRSASMDDIPELPHFELDPMCVQMPVLACDKEQDDGNDIPAEISALSDEELVYMAVGRFSEQKGFASVIGNAGSHVAGAAGETTSKLADKGITPLIMADGPAGLRLAKAYFEDEEGAHAVGTGPLPEGMLDVLSPPLRKILTTLTKGKKPPKEAEINHQYCTAIPIGTALAQSWNLDYAETLGDLVGAEMDRFGVDLWLAPALNIHRSILCGRNFEYFSEDPLISGKFAAAITRGVQSHPGRGTTIKHCAANNQELNRYYNNSSMSERTLREIYLKGFAICIREAQPLALMTSYNLINGRHTSENRSLIEGFLRTECGFKGIVMTDWVFSLKNRGVKYARAHAGRVAAAGGDLFMPGSMADYESILKALKTGMVSRRQIEMNAARVLRLIRKTKGD
ncbi:MAG: glycoside hydrolase family 3 protein [Lachnospiraceae bacterium]|nr:glycoside hydrolase family 3 protein [Lachnospiraceae bacterium]